MKKALVIGSGLGGLECGYILAGHGFEVTVLEQDKRPGGCLQTFRRRGSDGTPRLFDCGFHCVGGLGEGQSLQPLFSYFGLMDLPWRRMDNACFDEVAFAGSGERYPFASGHEAFVSALSEYFPSCENSLNEYASFLKSVGDNIFAPFGHPAKASGDGFSSRTSLTGGLSSGQPSASGFSMPQPSGTDGVAKQQPGMNSLFERSAYDFVNGSAGDPKLAKVLSGTSLKMELNADTLPLYVFAQINNSFIQSSWRLQGGGGQIADKLVASIEAFGGKVRYNAKVTKIVEKDGAAVGVELEGGEFIEADWIISDVHPSSTIAMIGESKAVRRIYRNRMNSLANTFGMFTANIVLRPETLPYLNRNIYVHRDDADLWRPDTSRTESVMVHYYVPEQGSYATHIDLLSPMSWEAVERWKDLPRKHRGEEYEALKAAKAKECIELASAAIPGLEAAIDTVYTSTPLTYNSYLGSPVGTAYGIRKDWNNNIGTVLSPRTPLPNLLLTGQSLNLHGILGVSMTSVMTCSLVPGLSGLPDEILGNL